MVSLVYIFFFGFLLVAGGCKTSPSQDTVKSSDERESLVGDPRIDEVRIEPKALTQIVRIGQSTTVEWYIETRVTLSDIRIMKYPSAVHGTLYSHVEPKRLNFSAMEDSRYHRAMLFRYDVKATSVGKLEITPAEVRVTFARRKNEKEATVITVQSASLELEVHE